MAPARRDAAKLLAAAVLVIAAARSHAQASDDASTATAGEASRPCPEHASLQTMAAGGSPLGGLAAAQSRCVCDEGYIREPPPHEKEALESCRLPRPCDPSCYINFATGIDDKPLLGTCSASLMAHGWKCRLGCPGGSVPVMKGTQDLVAGRRIAVDTTMECFDGELILPPLGSICKSYDSYDDILPYFRLALGFLCITVGWTFLLLQIDVAFNGRCCRFRGRALPIEDVSNQQGRTVLTTVGPHRLHTWRPRAALSICFTGTGHPVLDDPRSRFKMRIISADRLEILDEHVQLPSQRLDTSMGFVRLGAARTLCNTWYVVPVLILVVASGICGFAVLFDALYTHWEVGVGLERVQLDRETSGPGGSGDIRDIPDNAVVHNGVDIGEFAMATPLILLMALALALPASRLGRRCCSQRPVLPKQIREYRARLLRDSPNPQPSERGSARGLQVSQLLDFHEAFQRFIVDRTMYYVVSNIVYPITVPSKLSYSELAGPSELDWFVSHYWGHSFADFCDSIKKHAKVDGGHCDWRKQSYWICSFSNNQHRITEELGEDWSESSFYRALCSARRRGTCLIVDESALALTRSWCLFELAQTVKLEAAQAQGDGQLLFCTRTGVVNYGHATVEVSLGLAKKLAGLRLQDASASSQRDQDMIKELVVSQLGGFEAMNASVRARISSALESAKQAAVSDFERIAAELRPR